MTDLIYYFTLGASFMFSLMIAWLFWRNHHDIISRLVVALMIVVSVGFLKDLFLSGDSMLSISVDIVAVPIYAAILYELCIPGRLKIKTIILSELPFVIIPLLIAITGWNLLYYIDLALGIILGPIPNASEC